MNSSNMKNFKKLLFFLFLWPMLGSGVNYVVTMNTLNSNQAGTLDNAILQAMNYLNSNPGNATAVIQLSVNAGIIQLKDNLPLISIFLPNKTLIIERHPNPSVPLPVQGIDISYYALLPVPGCGNFCWTSPLYGLAFDGQNTTNNLDVLIRDIKFYNFNKTYYNYLTNPLFLPTFNSFSPPFTTYYNQPCAGGPPCILAGNCRVLSITTCTFENYNVGMIYRKIKTASIQNNLFTTDANSGVNCLHATGADGIILHDWSTNTVLNESVIQANTIEANPNTMDYIGSGIVINPYSYGDFQINQQLPNVNANLDIKVYSNQIKNVSAGFVQVPMQPNRTTEDLTYQMDIFNNNFLNAGFNIAIGGPYRHFKVRNNILNLKSTYPNPFSQNLYPTFISLGSYTMVTTNQGLLPKPFPGINKFGFRMIYANSLGLTPFNNTNTFNFINNISWTHDPAISTIGNFDKEVDFVGLNVNNYYSVGSGKNTNIRECKNTLNGIEQGNNNIVYNNPITHSNNLFSNPFNLTLEPSNGNINGPSLKSARITNNLLKVSFDLTGNQITPQNAPYIIEFFKSNIKGELTTFIGKQTINTLTGFTYSLTVVPQIGVTLTPGDRIGATITSIGTNPSPLGTSSVSYIYTIPCNDCISDFAPMPGKQYIVSCWTRASLTPQTAYGGLGGCSIKVTFYSALNPIPIPIGSPVLISQSGPMVDNWQKIEGNVIVPANATGMKMEFVTNEIGGTYVDDIRVFPVDATMKSYAYDPDNMRLMSELDERNFATLYEYDEEGKLIRVKKETEKGIMTIKESRNSKPPK